MYVHAQVNSRGVDRDCVMRKSNDKIVKGIKRIAISCRGLSEGDSNRLHIFVSLSP